MGYRDWLALLPAALLLCECSSGSIVASQEQIGPESPPPNDQLPAVQGSDIAPTAPVANEPPSSDDQVPALDSESEPPIREVSTEASCTSLCDSFAALQCPVSPRGTSCIQACLSDLNEWCGTQRIAYWQCVLDSGVITSCNTDDLETIPAPDCVDLANELMLCRCGPVYSLFGQCAGLKPGEPAPDGGSG